MFQNVSSAGVLVNTGSEDSLLCNFNPRKYVCHRGTDIVIDGMLSETSWKNARWTEEFTDIEGDIRPEPLYTTRAKMVWDDDYFYIAAEIYEKDINAHLKTRDTVIFHDNDFEVFIDPDGDTHNYYELEINAYNTVWDLLLTRPYRDQGCAVDAWDIKGLLTSVSVKGTINNPSDTDTLWTVEIAIPLDVLSECGNRPENNSVWRLNFSRVNWRYNTDNGRYLKERDKITGEKLPEYNWVWSPQGLVNMHYPEKWGYIQFADTAPGKEQVSFNRLPDENIKWNLRCLYYAQKRFYITYNKYAGRINKLVFCSNCVNIKDVKITLTPGGFQATLRSGETGRTWLIDQTGRIISIK